MANTGALQVTTPSEREIATTRVFDAPRHLVFDAWTTPELLKRWFHGPPGWSLVACDIDLKVGGAYRFVWHGPDGVEMGMGGVYREVVPPERLVNTESFDESWYPGEALVTTVLAEQGGRTTLTSTILYESREARDAAISSGMEQGVAASYDRLAELLASTAARDTIAGRYRGRADDFERKVAAVRPDQWSNQSPCKDWKARDVVRHIVDMHGAMLRPLGRRLSPAPSVDDDPLAAFRSARADIEAVLYDPALAGTEHDTPGGRMTVEQHVDQVVSADMVLHGWDLARATGQDDTIDPREVEQMWAATSAIPAELMEKMRTPGAFGPGVEVFGPEVKVPQHAPLQDRLLGLIGRDPRVTPTSVVRGSPAR
jgi:uncharacterized protein (TIGR03086 family)